MPSRTVLLDTSFIVALENCDDRCHDRARELDRELLATNATLLLHWGIVLEIGDGYARLGRRTKGIELLKRLCQEEGYRIVLITEPLIASAVSLYSERLYLLNR